MEIEFKKINGKEVEVRLNSIAIGVLTRSGDEMLGGCYLEIPKYQGELIDLLDQSETEEEKINRKILDYCIAEHEEYLNNNIFKIWNSEA